MAGAVDHKGAVGVSWFITDAHAWNLPHARGDELPNGLHRIKKPTRCARTDRDPIRANIQPVALPAGNARIDRARDEILNPSLTRDRKNTVFELNLIGPWNNIAAIHARHPSIVTGRSNSRASYADVQNNYVTIIIKASIRCKIHTFSISYFPLFELFSF